MKTVKEVIAKKGEFVESIEKHSSVYDAAQRMNERKIGALVVTEKDSVIGIFTERDILQRVVAARGKPEDIRVGDVMTSPVACCKHSTTLEECTGVMTEKRIRHLPVVEEGRLCGIITSGDILAHRVTEHQETIEYLNQYIFGTYRQT
jgi:signal-transduction protein with cAMP-binding, CBS, and nucleotidyltransferase domain